MKRKRIRRTGLLIRERERERERDEEDEEHR